ncbi:mitochondrial fusion GTPase protein [Delitschia confertaspora ATCC 74209]|uniref:Mitochondrial fusion GTPase protein n=1 Tax=Delitschia confertaspora ATCC 74209 TaxID=1513339 RepID=A0A9P4JRY2_9PLEO|nr:mitochondrial fusion GTPase protein [Delitschia confertaspora ATCC 74209]
MVLMDSNQRSETSDSPRDSSSAPRHGSSSSSFVPVQASARPHYMTVGSGSTPEAAARLVSMLDDSGYGGSLMDGENSSQGWHSGVGSSHTATPSSILTGGETDYDRPTVASHILQLHYNQNKNTLGRAIHGTIDTLKNFQEMNLKWPAHYPSVQSEPQPLARTNTEPRPTLPHTQSVASDYSDFDRSAWRPHAPRRAGTSIGEDTTIAESSSAAAREPTKEPRLVTPQLVQDFSVLKLELRMGSRTQTDLVHSLEKGSIASLLDGQIQQSIRHLYSLKERIEDTSSKVLVTGDLNAGKSTFCNALLRRKILPEDQQPCTSIFCEVLDFRENGGVEEVHAIPIGATYNRHDESTYAVFPLRDLERVVIDSEHFSQCKIYIQDIRSVDESLLNNGVVDIALIDAPGLNNDSLKTTAVFARQEEIDVVVFVVSAANHFTLSAKEFIFNAAREKAYIFMVVNGFDNIRDKKRCQEMILKQVAHLSPATFKESRELVHFVSSNSIPMSVGGPPTPGSDGNGASGHGSGGGGGDGDNDPADDEGSSASEGKRKGKGKEPEKQRDFDELETSLRRFVLEKRARSKLAPAKTYLLNLLGDVCNLALVNRDVAQSELDRVKTEMDALEPEYEQSQRARTEAGETVDRTMEETVSEAFNYTRDTLNGCISRVGEQDLGIEYPGLLSAYQYAEDLRDSMLHEITETVRLCEEHARGQAVQGYNAIKNLGIMHLGNTMYADVMFRPERMFRKPTHALARQVDIDIELWDFFDIGSLWERQEKMAGTGMAVTVAGMVGSRVIGGVGWLDGALGAAKIMGPNNLRRLIIPGLLATVVIGVSYVLTSVPKSLPRRLSAKLSSQLAALDYTHANALRISSEIRRVLKGPANELRIGLQRNVEKLHAKREETNKFKGEAEVAQKYFGNLVRKSNELRQSVQRVDLEGVPAGLAIQGH